MDAKTQYAIMRVQDSELWQICHDLDWPEGLHQQYSELTQKREKFGNENFEKLYTFSGCSAEDENGNYRGHYEIEDEIEADGWVERGITLDSESSGFFSYAPESLKDEFCDYLNENFEWEGKMEPYWADYNGFCDPFGRVENAKKFLDEKGIEVPVLVSDEVLNAVERMKYLKERKEKSGQEFEKAIENLKKNL